MLAAESITALGRLYGGVAPGPIQEELELSGTRRMSSKVDRMGRSL